MALCRPPRRRAGRASAAARLAPRADGRIRALGRPHHVQPRLGDVDRGPRRFRGRAAEEARVRGGALLRAGRAAGDTGIRLPQGDGGAIATVPRSRSPPSPPTFRAPPLPTVSILPSP